MQSDDTQIKYFYSRIDKAIKDNGWTPYRLAKEAGIPKSTMNSMIEKKSEPRMLNLVKICGACKIGLEEIRTCCDYTDTKNAQIFELYQELDDANKEALIRMARFYLSEQNNNTKK